MSQHNDPSASNPNRPVTPDLRVLIADDVDVLRTVLTELLNATEGIEVCAHAADGDEAVDLALATRPDAILMDLKMPRKDGITAAKEILSAWPEAKIIINSAFADKALIQSALDAGVIGYQTKDRRPTELIDLLLQLRQG